MGIANDKRSVTQDLVTNCKFLTQALQVLKYQVSLICYKILHFHIGKEKGFDFYSRGDIS